MFAARMPKVNWTAVEEFSILIQGFSEILFLMFTLCQNGLFRFSRRDASELTIETRLRRCLTWSACWLQVLFRKWYDGHIVLIVQHLFNYMANFLYKQLGVDDCHEFVTFDYSTH